MRNNLKIFKEKDDILSLSVKINTLMKTNLNVINATIGTLYDDNGNLAILNDVKEIRNSLKDEEVYPYISTLGIKDFKNVLVDFLWQDYKNKFIKKKHIELLPTPGATGALNLALYMTLNPKETILLPKICWNVYYNMAKELDLNVETYKYLDKNNKFALNDFIKKVKKISLKQKHIVTILNDPCNNPTGYSLTKKEFIDLINFMNSQKDLTFTLIYDVAYYEYSMENTREKFSLLGKLNKNVLTIITWSASKTFTMYGLRFGCIIFIDSFQRKVINLLNKAKIIARGRFSCISSEAANITYKILSNNNLLISFKNNLDVYKKMLNDRINLFIKQALEINLPIIPYHGGFFVAIKTNKVDKLTNLLEKENIFVTKNYHLIRIAICSLTYDQCDGLAYKIKKCLDKI